MIARLSRTTKRAAKLSKRTPPWSAAAWRRFVIDDAWSIIKAAPGRRTPRLTHRARWDDNSLVMKTSRFLLRGFRRPREIACFALGKLERQVLEETWRLG